MKQLLEKYASVSLANKFNIFMTRTKDGKVGIVLNKKRGGGYPDYSTFLKCLTDIEISPKSDDLETMKNICTIPDDVLETNGWEKFWIMKRFYNINIYEIYRFLIELIEQQEHQEKSINYQDLQLVYNFTKDYLSKIEDFKTCVDQIKSVTNAKDKRDQMIQFLDRREKKYYNNDRTENDKIDIMHLYLPYWVFLGKLSLDSKSALRDYVSPDQVECLN